MNLTPWAIASLAQGVKFKEEVQNTEKEVRNE
jgi:hypothetical protein